MSVNCFDLGAMSARGRYLDDRPEDLLAVADGHAPPHSRLPLKECGQKAWYVTDRAAQRYEIDISVVI
jgi:hypothetical protein